MSAAIAALAASYGSGSGSESDSDSEGSRCPLPAADSLMHLTKSPSAKPSLTVAVDSAPEVAVKVSVLATVWCGNWFQLPNGLSPVRCWFTWALRSKLPVLTCLPTSSSTTPHLFCLHHIKVVR